MNKSYKAASSVGAVMLVLSGTVMAAAPVTEAWFDQWTVSSGTISHSGCPAGMTCSAGALTDKGFSQRTLLDTDGVTYFQTVITEANASATTAAELEALTFSDESFVRTGNVGGIADRQRIAEEKDNGTSPASVTTFKEKTTLFAGFAGNSLSLDQYLKDGFDDFQTDFIFRQVGADSTGAGASARAMKITAYVPIQSGDTQDFVLVDMAGDYNHVASTPIDGSGKSYVDLQYASSASDTMTWTVDDTAGTGGNVGDHIQAIWIGQDLTNILGQEFGYSSYSNFSPSAATANINGFSLINVDPLLRKDGVTTSWDTAIWGDRVTKTATVGTPVTNPFTLP